MNQGNLLIFNITTLKISIISCFVTSNNSSISTVVKSSTPPSHAVNRINNTTITIPSEVSNITGNAKGVLVGGNLSMLYSLCGSSSSISTKGKILFIEDLDEYLYHIDRMLQNLKRNGMLDQLEGLIIGGMTQMHDNDIPFGQSTEEIILSICNDYNYPIVFNFPAGHIKDNRALILGRKAELIISKTETILTFDS